jgi:predicted peptidase
MQKVVFLLTILMLGLKGFAQDIASFEKKEYVQNEGTLKYRILYPLNYKPKKKYPLIVFMHGGGERGSDNEAQLKHGGVIFLRDSIRKKYPAIVIFPQCPKDSFWTSVIYGVDSTGKEIIKGNEAPGKPSLALRLVKSLVDVMIKEKKVDVKRIYVGGLSMGGYGTYAFAANYPGIPAAAFPICGGGRTSLADSYDTKVPWWLFHGDKDPVIKVQFSRDFYKKMKAMGMNVQYTEYPGVAHDSWNNMFEEKNFFSWLFAQKRK